MSSLKSEPKKRGRKPKNPAPANTEKPRGPRGRAFDFARVYKESSNLKVNEEDELLIIDKETYIKGTREPPVLYREEQKKPAREEAVRQESKEIRSEHDKEEDKKDRSLLIDWENQKGERMELQKSRREKVNEEMRSIRLFSHNNEKDDKVGGRFREEKFGNHQGYKISQGRSEKDKQPINKIELQGHLNEVNHEQGNSSPSDQQRNIVQQPQENLRPFMNTQEERYCVEPEQNYPGLYDEMPADYYDEYLIRDNASPEDDVIDSFVRGRRHRDKPLQPNPAEIKEISEPEFVEVELFLNEAQKSAQNAKEENIKTKNEENLYKRGINHAAESQEADILCKRIKPNEEVEQPEKKETIPTIINLIDDDSPFESIRSRTSKKPLKQLMRKQLQSLLNNGANQSIEQRLQKTGNTLQILLQHGDQSSVSKAHCVSCERQNEEANQLRYLFNELLQQEQINLDAFFLQQQTLTVLSSLNPNFPCSSSKFLRSNKMTDISDNSTLRLLISRKIALIDTVPAILSDYSLKKLIKMGDEWIGIFQINKSQAKTEHFKYVQATDLLLIWRNQVVDFLMR